MKIVVTGGGTGGHIYPALALAGGFRAARPDVQVLYVGAANGMEQELAARAGYEFRGVSVAPLARSSMSQLVQGLKVNSLGLKQAKKIMREFQPDLVCGTGGYVCGPVVLAACQLHIPTMIHEQNAVPGIANKALSLFCDLICLTFPQAASHLFHKKRQILTGLPVRAEILNAQKAAGVAEYQLDPARPILVVTGGSQGARKLNQTMVPLWRSLLDNGVQIVHITGPKLYEETLLAAGEQGVAEQPDLHLLPYA
ncbi:MAG: UDP-N-acetylglucosamine--N-acetylmuramyl-(pentapeptide) pyrophosphoryl-undecaprenol N-acetylglucosamine transferase, partial [Clostridiales bacterium]